MTEKLCPKCGAPLKPFKVLGQYIKGSWLVCYACDHDEEEKIEPVRLVPRGGAEKREGSIHGL
jgi:uncharacterized Zn finger protein (UPF0148 family)